MTTNCGNSAENADALNLVNGYGTTNNNGNVLSQMIPRSGTAWSQSYGYDNLNRLLSASEGSN